MVNFREMTPQPKIKSRIIIAISRNKTPAAKPMGINLAIFQEKYPKQKQKGVNS